MMTERPDIPHEAEPEQSFLYTEECGLALLKWPITHGPAVPR